MIQIFPASGGQPKTLSLHIDGQPSIAGWSADGKRIYFSEAKGTGTQIYAARRRRQPHRGNKTDSGRAQRELTSTAPALRSAFVSQTSDTPPDAYIASVSISPPSRSHA